jgi:hypothetical protein
MVSWQTEPQSMRWIHECTGGFMLRFGFCLSLKPARFSQKRLLLVNQRIVSEILEDVKTGVSEDLESRNTIANTTYIYIYI